MVSKFEGNPRCGDICLMDVVNEMCSTQEEFNEMIEILDGRVYD